jgi:hypothetical protein
VLDTIPPSAIKYCLTKKWLRPHGNNGFYFVTETAAFDLKLPRKFKGGQHHGHRIRFAV